MKNTPHLFPNSTTTLFLTDGGIETTLMFIEGYALPCFAAFDLLKDDEGREALRSYYRKYLEIAKNYKTNFVLESPTWRASPDWIQKTGYPPSAVTDVNEKAIELMIGLRKTYENDIDIILISGCVGPQGDGYKPECKMSIESAGIYHSPQIQVFKEVGVDMVSAITMNYLEEAIGIARAANALDVPSVISFTLETNGKLPDGTDLKMAIDMLDNSVEVAPLYYMINCAHPTHFIKQLEAGIDEGWVRRIMGIRANASCKSHAELDEATELDRGNPDELAHEYKHIKETFYNMTVFGGCCGTDDAHLRAIARELKPSGELIA